MPYAFDLSDLDLEASLRRVVDEELGAALARLEQIARAEAVHGIRKSLKKTRALLRLVRTGLASQPAMNLALREVGLALSGRRDADVRLATLDRLFPDPPQVLQPLRAALKAEGGAASGNPPQDLRQALSAIRESLRNASLTGKDDRILRQGLAVTRSKARRAAAAACRNPGAAEVIHDWRKRAKDLWYQSRLFAPCWPDLFKPIVASADRLGESLGDHHDLSVLAAHVAGLPDALVPDLARRMLDARLRDAQARIEAEAFPLSARLLAGDPEDMAALWVDWRRLWRGAAGHG
jgi:CHAD domain-containing protein